MARSYDAFRFLYPPRPETRIYEMQFPHFDGYVAQVKMDGTCNVLAIDPDRRISARTRQGGEHINWAPSFHTSRPFHQLQGGWYVFVAELMHSKGGGLRDINYIHDILVADGKHLVGLTFAERQRILSSLFRLVCTEAGHHVIDDHTWLARNSFDIQGTYDSLDKRWHEGIVLKDPDSKLAACVAATSNASWQVKALKSGHYY